MMLAQRRTAMLAAKAAAAGCTVDELIRRGEALVERQRRQYEIRCDRRSAWATIERATRERGRMWMTSAWRRKDSYREDQVQAPRVP